MFFSLVFATSEADNVFYASSAALAVFDGDIAALKIFPQGADHRLCC